MHRGGVLAASRRSRARSHRAARREQLAPVAADGQHPARRRAPGRVPAPEPCSQVSSSSGLPTVADRPTRWSGRPIEMGEPFQDGEQVPASVVAGERMDLVDDDGAQAGEERAWSTLRLTSIDSSDSGVVSRMSGRAARIARRRDAVTSPCQRAARRPEPAGVPLQPGMQVVEQRPQRAEVEHRRAGPALGGHPGQQRKWPLPRSCRRRWAPAAGRPRRRASGSTAPPATGAGRATQGVDDVVQQDRVQQVGGGSGHRSRAMSSALAALRSTSVISAVRHRERVVLAGVEVGELVDPVEHVADELLQEEAGRDADLAAQSAGNGAGQLTEVCVIDDDRGPARRRMTRRRTGRGPCRPARPASRR